MFHKIVVPLDGSKLAERALTPAVQLAKSQQAKLLLVRAAAVNYSVVPEPMGYGYLMPQESPDLLWERATAYLEEIRAALVEQEIPVEVLIEDGDPAAVIVDAAAAHTADLVIMTTHGYAGVSRWVLGSVTEKVLRHATCPVLAVRTATLFKHILITLDGSPLSERALPPALAIAAAFAASVTLLRVDDEPLILDADRVTAIDQYERKLSQSVHEGSYQRIQDYLQSIVETFTLNLVTPVQTAKGEGVAAHSILAYAAEHNVDLIAMSTHGRSGIQRWVYGSVTEKVLRAANCAMLVVHAPQQAE